MDRDGREDWKPLHNAVRHCFHELLRSMVLDQGLEVSASDHIGHSALHKALIKGCYTCCQILVELGANVNQRDVFGQTPLFVGCLNGISGPLAELLIRSGANPAIANRERQPALSECVDSNNVAASKELLKATSTELLLSTGIPVTRDRTPTLKHVVIKQKHDILVVFLQHLLQKEVPESEFEGTLALACQQKDTVAVKIILTLTGVHVHNALIPYSNNSLSMNIPDSVATKLGLRYAQILMQGCCDVTQLTPFVYSKENYPLEDYSCLLDLLFNLVYRFTEDDKEYIHKVSEELYDSFNRKLKHAHSLSNICRVVIRSCLKTNPLHAVGHLPLPNGIKDFLLLGDIVMNL